MKKLSAAILSLLLLVFSAVTAIPALATSQDGLEAVITTTKDSYAANEDIDVKLSIKNTGNRAVGAVHAAITLPEGLELKAGSLATENIDLLAGEEKTYSLTAIKKAAGSETSTPSESVNDGTPPTAGSPDTGIGPNILLWSAVAVAVLSVAVLVLIRASKSRHKTLLSLILCVTLVGSMAMPFAAGAVGNEKNLTATQQVTVDGEPMTITAVVSYTLPDEVDNLDNEYADNWELS